MRLLTLTATLLILPSAAYADCIYTGAKRAYLECIYAEAVAATTQLLDVGASLVSLDARATATEGDISFLEASALTLSDGLASLSTALDTLTTQVTGIDVDLSNVEADVADLQADVAAISGGGGGGGMGSCITHFGKNTCPAGFSAAYSGHWGVMHRYGTASMSSAVCIDDAGFSWLAGGTNFDITSRVNNNNLETYDEGTGAQLSGCAVCCPTAGSVSYVHWGESSCAAGYSTFHTGNAAVLANYGTGGGASSLMCMDDAGYTWTAGSTDWSWVSRTCGGSNDCHDGASGALSACSVCYR